MTIHELQAVENFTISNEHGSIQFTGATDLVGVDLARDVTINAKSVEVYPKNPKASTKPYYGEKLNKLASITLCGGIKPKKGLTAAEYEAQLKKNLEKNGGKHVYYDANTRTWEFNVPGF